MNLIKSATIRGLVFASIPAFVACKSDNSENSGSSQSKSNEDTNSSEKIPPTSIPTQPSEVVGSIGGRYLAYSGSFFGDAIDSSKIALQRGQKASFSNYSGYDKGITGVLVELSGPVSELSINDFSFRVGNSSSLSEWVKAPDPVSISKLASDSSKSRYLLKWNDGSIKDIWLEITVEANARTTLKNPDTFYFGNYSGDTGVGNSDSANVVNAVDQAQVQTNLSAKVDVSSPFDINKDGIVDALDKAISSANVTTSSKYLSYISIP